MLDKIISDETPALTMAGTTTTASASMYFSGWQEQPMKWKGLARRPIPQDWHRCGFRTGVLVSGNRHAAHPVNAMLNYG